jgi:hypothetical protein
MDASLLQHDRPMSFRTLFFVIPSVSEESTHGCFASLSMTNWWMLHFAQHDKTEDVIPSVSEESSTWMLRFAQHDKLVDASLRSHDRPMSFRTLFFVIPSVSEESSTWMLRFAQHDKLVDASLHSA